MLTAFLASPAASVQGRVLGVEEEIRGMLAEGVPDSYGRVDLLTEDSDSLVVTDINTSRGKWSQELVEDSGEQLLLYSHLASEIGLGKKIATRFLVLTKAKEPVVEEHVREVEPENVKRTSAGIECVWRAPGRTVLPPPLPATPLDARAWAWSGCIQGEHEHDAGVPSRRSGLRRRQREGQRTAWAYRLALPGSGASSAP